MTAADGQWFDRGRINVADTTVMDGESPPNSFNDDRGLFVIHAALTHFKGKVLWFCGHVEHGHYALYSYLYDYKAPPNTQLKRIPFPRHNPALARTGATGALPDPQAGVHADLFCCHMCQTVDGRIAVVGGADPDFGIPGGPPPGGGGHGSVGERYIYLFNPVTEQWDMATDGSKIHRLGQGRWYPTCLMLGDGRIMVVSGREAHGELGTTFATSIAETVELLTPPDLEPVTLSGATRSPPLPIYPGLHLAPNGRVYYTHTTWGLEVDPPANTISIEVAPGATSASWQTHAGVAPSQPRREEGMSVLLPPAQDGRILLIGGTAALNNADVPIARSGGPSVFDHIANATDPFKAEVLDTSGANPTWSSLPDLNHARTNGHCVILPDSTVLILGGHDNYRWNAIPVSNPSLVCEIFDPATNTFDEVDSLAHPRMYHSAAVLLPDGSVLVAGGADPNGVEPIPPYPVGWNGPVYGAGMPLNRKDHEVYHPPYFFKGARPEITAVKRNGAETGQVAYDQAFEIDTAEAASIDKVVLTRPNCVTHHTDTDQRLVTLTFTKQAGKLTATMPSNRNLAPPGFYLLWIVDGTGRPCKEAPFVQLTEPPPAPAASGSSSGSTDDDKLCVVVTAATGSADSPDVRFMRDIRARVRGSGPAGSRFMDAVNAAYYSVSPPLARAMHRRAALREAVRDLAVTPAVRGVRQVTRWAGVRPEGGIAPATALRAMAGLIALGLVALLAAPAVALAVALRVRRQEGKRRDG